MTRGVIEKLLAGADIQIGGSRPWDLRVHDKRFYARVLRQGSLGLGESYMDGWWDCDAVDEFLARIFQADIPSRVRRNPVFTFLFLRSFFSNAGRKSRAFEIGRRHYDIGNDLYRAMLDSRMTYTCGYWRPPTGSRPRTLDDAQDAKLDLVCRKIGLKKGDHVLDIGCGWGSFAKYAAEIYGARVTGITVSREQVELGAKRCAGLPVELRLQDYRDVRGEFDHVISLGMFEHVGCKNYRGYMKIARRCLKDGGLFLLHTIGGNRSVRHTDPWIDKYIFPGSMLPSARQIAEAAEGLFIMEDWHNFGADYDTTLMAWFANFDAGWPQLQDRYGDRFYRMWKFYLLSCAGSFRARKNQLWQIVFSRCGVPGGYRPIR